MKFTNRGCFLSCIINGPSKRILTPSRAAVLLDLLNNSEHERSQLLVLTDKGEEIMGKVSDIDRDMLKRMTKGMAEDELEQFRKMAQNLES